MSAERVRSRSRSVWLSLGGLALVLAAAVWLLGGSDTEKGRWEPVRQGTLAPEVEVRGVLRAERSLFLGPPQIPGFWNQKISMMAPEGTVVRPGQPVLRFDTRELSDRLREAQARVDELTKEIEKERADQIKTRQDAALRLAEAEARQRRLGLRIAVPEELEKATELRKDRIDHQLATRELEHLRRKSALEERLAAARLGALRRDLERSSDRVRELENRIAEMTVTAPREGTVIYLSRRGQEKPKVGDTVWGGSRVVELPDLSSMRAEGEVDEADAGAIAVGQLARLQLDAFPGVEIRGEVAEVGSAVRAPVRGSPLRAFPIEIRLAETDPKTMRPGMRLRGTITTGEPRDALLLPIDAVRAGPEGDTVRRKTLWGSEEVAVSLGQWSGERVEVLEGLAAGDRVWLPAGGEP